MAPDAATSPPQSEAKYLPVKRQAATAMRKLRSPKEDIQMRTHDKSAGALARDGAAGLQRDSSVVLQGGSGQLPDNLKQRVLNVAQFMAERSYDCNSSLKPDIKPAGRSGASSRAGVGSSAGAASSRLSAGTT